MPVLPFGVLHEDEKVWQAAVEAVLVHRAFHILRYEHSGELERRCYLAYAGAEEFANIGHGPGDCTDSSHASVIVCPERDYSGGMQLGLPAKRLVVGAGCKNFKCIIGMKRSLIAKLRSQSICKGTRIRSSGNFGWRL